VSESAIAEVVAVLQPWQIMTRLEDADEWDVIGVFPLNESNQF